MTTVYAIDTRRRKRVRDWKNLIHYGAAESFEYEGGERKPWRTLCGAWIGETSLDYLGDHEDILVTCVECTALAMKRSL